MPGGSRRIDEYNRSLTPEQRKESARRAASAPRPNLRRNADIRKIARAINDAPAGKKLRERLASLNVSDADMANAAGIALAVYEAAQRGNMAAVEKWESYVGQHGAGSRDDGMLEDLIRGLRE